MNDARTLLIQESQEWARNTFGSPPSLERVIGRAFEEWAELFRSWTSRASRPEDETIKQVAEEAADIWIVLCRALDALGESEIGPVDDDECESITKEYALKFLGECMYECERFLWPGAMMDEKWFLPDIIGAMISCERVINSFGSTLKNEVNRKLAINRARKWEIRDGAGYHIRDRDIEIPVHLKAVLYVLNDDGYPIIKDSWDESDHDAFASGVDALAGNDVVVMSSTDFRRLTGQTRSDETTLTEGMDLNEWWKGQEST